MAEKESSKAPAAATKDTDQDRILAALAYVGFLWLVPLLAAKDSKFAMYHANQGLVLFVAGIVLGFISGIIPIIGWFIMAPLVSLAVLILAIMGIINAVSGKMTPLPVIGSFEILK